MTAAECKKLRKLAAVYQSAASGPTINGFIAFCESSHRTRRAFSDADKQYVREHFGKRPVKCIAYELGREPKTIYQLARAMGLSRPQRLKLVA